MYSYMKGQKYSTICLRVLIFIANMQVQTSEKRTNHQFRMCPFFRGFTVIIIQGHFIFGV